MIPVYGISNNNAFIGQAAHYGVKQIPYIVKLTILLYVAGLNYFASIETKVMLLPWIN